MEFKIRGIIIQKGIKNMIQQSMIVKSDASSKRKAMTIEWALNQEKRHEKDTLD